MRTKANLITFLNSDACPARSAFSCCLDGKQWGLPHIRVHASRGGAVALTEEPYRCRFLARIGNDVHVLLNLKGPGFLPLITESCAHLLQRAGVHPEDRHLSLLQVSRIYGLDPMLQVPRSLDRLLWRWQFAVHEAANAIIGYGLGHQPT